MGNLLYYKGIQLPQLRSFCTVATQGNFTSAAQMLGLSVPTVWQQVRSLERELSTTLLRRRGRAVELTEDGRLLRELLQPHVRGIDALRDLFQAKRAEMPRQFTLACTHYLLAHHLPMPLKHFTDAYPTVRLSLRPGLWQEGIQLVERGAAELGIVPYDPEEARSPYLEYETLFEMQLMLLTALDHPLARKRRIQPRDLVQYPMVLMPKGTHSRKMLDRILQRYDLSEQVHVVLESFGVDLTCQYVAMGMGIALMYLGPDGDKKTPGLRRQVFDKRLAGLPVALVIRKGAHLSEPAESFRRLVREQLS